MLWLLSRLSRKSAASSVPCPPFGASELPSKKWQVAHADARGEANGTAARCRGTMDLAFAVEDGSHPTGCSTPITSSLLKKCIPA